MNLALFRKTLRDYALLFILILPAIVLFETVAVRLLIEAAKDIELIQAWINKPFIQSILRLSLGADLGNELNAGTLSAIWLAHPLLYSLTWTLILTIATGVTVGEISRGTADLVLTLPVSRAAVYVTTSSVWVLAAVGTSVAPLLGLWIGDIGFKLKDPLNYPGLRAVMLNYFLLNLSIGAVTMCVSSFLSRRGVAIGIMMAGLLSSNLIDLLGQFWPPMSKVSFLGFLYYYRPLPVLREAAVAPLDVAVLLGVAVTAWVVGLIVFSRRDVPAA